MSAGLVVVPVCTAALLAALHRAQSRWHLAPELARKLFHVAGGMLCLWLPVWFASGWPVALLSAGLIAGLLLLRIRGGVRVLSAVHRGPAGEICFPAGVTVLFALARGDRLAYTIPLLILTCADAAAGLVGSRFGRVRVGAGKTLEGSLAFFVVALAIALCAVELRPALRLAAALTILEACTSHGLDNLLIPVCGFFLLP